MLAHLKSISDGHADGQGKAIMIGLGSGAMKMVTWSPQSCWHSSSLTTFSWKICHQISFSHLTLNKLSKKLSAYKNGTLCVDSFLHIVTTHKHTCGGGDVCRVLSDDGECGVEAELGSGKLCKTDASQNQHGIKVSKTDASRLPLCPDHGFKVSRFLPNRSKSACLLSAQDTKCSLLCQPLQVVRAAEIVPTPF